jgi:nucleotide-binding universal stress UspA family protein
VQPIRNVLHPTDFSECSDYAFRLACSLARDYSARLVALHVVTPPVVIYDEGVLLPGPSTYKDQLWKQLQQLQAGDPKVPVEYRLVEGEAATEILRMAQEMGCDLIVLGTHGRTGLGRLLLGSVAEQVMRRASCPVLTVKTLQRPLSTIQEPSATTAGRGAEAGK